MNLHRFRHAAATTMAIEDPEHVGVAMTVNGHADPATMQVHYNLASQQSATLRYHDALAVARKAAEARQRERGKRKYRKAAEPGSDSLAPITRIRS